ncbi:ABC transporter ATP-binding protein [Ilumatobacter nonamiensis]|uniref:ABC transporter ATP-binding protein n=1 Tax=Ilumatobacter nonamiensis TaxID=467093 RepID=UPI000684F91C|nr:ATP-binding cassette domain-containing protein [Ilumatobacter nonamiensis]
MPSDTGSLEAVSTTPTLSVENIVLRRDGVTILDDVTLRIERDQRWVIVGANGCGKTSLMRVMAMYDHPSSGTVDVLGERLGRTDVRELRRRIGYMSAALGDQLRPDLLGHDIVRTALHGALEPWWHRYTEADDRRADECLVELGVSHLRARRFATMSSGERQRVLLARTLMNDPAVILLDEPSARLDLGGREQLVTTLSELATNPTAPPIAMVTHHVDEIPAGITHAAIMKAGRIISSGPIDETLTSESLSACFDLALHLERRHDGRLSAWGV